jgi:hypothetical protein
MHSNFLKKREEKENQKDAYIKLYRGVLAQVPNFKKTLEEFGDDFESIMDLIGVVSLIFFKLFILTISFRWIGNLKTRAARY